MSYEGFCNLETWTVALWVDNDANLSDLRHQMHFTKGSANWLKAQQVVDAVRLMAQSGAPALRRFIRDVGDFSKVNYVELAEHWGAKEPWPE